MIPYNKQYIDKKDINSVFQSMKSKLITGGPIEKKFEKKLKNFFKCNYVSLVNSGTSALFLCFLSLKIKKDDIVIIPSVNFIAAYNLLKFLKAKVFLTDVDPVTGLMTEKNLIECIKKNNLKKIKLVILMHLGGNVQDLDKFYKLKKKYNFKILEDACHALGSKYIINKRKYMTGSSKHSDCTIFSLHAIKSITTGEGGIVCTNNENLIKNINYLKSHGIKRNSKFHWKYDVLLNGFNFRLSEINCALGLSQLKKIKLFIKKRQILAKRYVKKLRKIVNIEYPEFNIMSCYHLFIISINRNSSFNKNRLIYFLKKKGIIAQFHYIPINKFKVFNEKKTILKDTEKYYKNCLSIPLYYTLTFKHQDYVIKQIKNYFR